MIVVNLDVMLAKRKMSLGELSERVGITLANLSIMKNNSCFVITHESLMKLPEETRNTFFNSISLDFPSNTRKQIYHYYDQYGEVHNFVYTNISPETIV